MLPGGAERIPFGTAKLVTRLGRPSAGAGRKGLGPALSRLPSKGGAHVPPSSPRRTLQGGRMGPLMTREESKGLETLS